LQPTAAEEPEALQAQQLPPAASPPPSPLPSQSSSGSVLTMVPGESIQQRYILRDGEVQPIFIFHTQFPKFIGSANEENSVVKVDIFGPTHITGKAQVDSNGNWSYQSAVPILPGTYTVQAQLVGEQSPESLAKDSLVFEVVLDKNQAAEVLRINNKPQVGNSGTLFDVRTVIDQSSKVITAGAEARANIELLNFQSSDKAIDVEVQYSVRNAKNEVVLQSSETVAVSGKVSFWKSFYTATSLVTGFYTLTVAVPSQDLIATATDTFQIKTAAAAETSSFLGLKRPDFKITSPLVIGLVVGFLAFLIWIAYLQYKKVVILSRSIKELTRTNLAVAKQVVKARS
jgi:hypothetical protein